MKQVGVLALQGAVNEHLNALQKLGVKGIAIKTPQALTQVDSLIIPGGESTAMSRLMIAAGLVEPLKLFAQHHPVLGTCAGLIMASHDIEDNDSHVMPLDLLPITVRRNGFGRQIDSFETHLTIEGVGVNIPAVFIRAPFITHVGEGVEVMTRYEDRIVMVKFGHIWVCAFHPELTDDTRILAAFIHQPLR